MLNIRINREILGLRTEIAGLALLLIALIWQVFFTDWADRFQVEQQNFIQETSNLAVLISIADLATALNISDSVTKKKILLRVSDSSKQAVSELIDLREKGKKVDDSIAKLFKGIRVFLSIFGALLIIAGKALVMRHKKTNSTS